MPEDFDRIEERLSKSQRKRDSLALQALGGKLVGLPLAQLESLALPADLLKEIFIAQSIRQGSARKRQMKYIGKLLSHLPIEPIHEKLAEFEGKSAHSARQHHRIERWRDRLLAEGDKALSELLEASPLLDRQKIRQWVRSAQDEQALGKPPRAARALYRYLRAHIEFDEGKPI